MVRAALNLVVSAKRILSAEDLGITTGNGATFGTPVCHAPHLSVFRCRLSFCSIQKAHASLHDWSSIDVSNPLTIHGLLQAYYSDQ